MTAHELAYMSFRNSTFNTGIPKVSSSTALPMEASQMNTITKKHNITKVMPLGEDKTRKNTKMQSTKLWLCSESSKTTGR